MGTIKIFQKSAIASFALLFASAVLMKCTDALGENITAVKKGEYHNYDAYRACKMIKSSEIRSAISKSKTKKVILNIYPVKLSNSPRQEDFDLKMVFLDAVDHKSINKVDEKLLKSQSDWYVSFLKSNGVPRNKVPFGYYIPIDSGFLKHSVGVSICVALGQVRAQYYLLTDKPGTTKISAMGDSTCKCPPDCCQYYLLLSDSTGKCPPECGGFLLYQTTIQSIIEKKYKND